MKITKQIATLLLGFVASATSLTAWADVPFEPTTITAGKFAENTKWYTMTIGAGSLRIHDNADQNYIQLGGQMRLKDENLWCFVGDETNGFLIYNKQAGPTKALAASSTMSGANGGTTYPTLQNVEGLASSIVNRWDFKKASKASNGQAISVANGYYVNEHGHSSYIINNRDGKLAFWSAGYDNGSAVVVSSTKATFFVDLKDGKFTSTNTAGTWASTWKSNAVGPQLALNCGNNNMCKVGTTNSIAIASGQNGSATYTLSPTVGYVIESYSFKVKNQSSTTKEVTLKVGSKEYKVTNEAITITASGLNATSTNFTLSGDNHGVQLTDFVVNVALSDKEPEPQTDLMKATGLPTYRIPAIAKAYNGDLISVADYRYNGSDIGGGKLDLRARISKDNGKTWGEIFTIVKGEDYVKGKTSSKFLHTGFGDPCIIADRESNRVLLMSCTGDVMFPSATRDYHQGIARFYSEDNGQTWSKPVDISESIYSQFDKSKIGSARSMFIGSGRIFQSSTVKVGDYYRLYCSVLFKDINGTNKNYVIYSDNFGDTWSVLGGVDVAPIPSGADEPKAEELPDGSVLCSSRCSGGRYYNIFHFTNSQKAEGSWDNVAFSGASNNGVVAEGNSTNGEVMVVPAQRKSDGKDVYLLLQSVPFGSARNNVGIYYKELASLADFDTPANLAKNWTGRHQSSYIGSAYSTMILQADNHIGFLYEEETYGYAYTIVYKNYTLETITDSAYTFKANVDKATIVKDGIDAKAENVKKNVGTNVGNYTEDALSAISTALEAYQKESTTANYEMLNAALEQAPRVQIREDIKYRFRNAERQSGTLYMVASSTGLTAAKLNESNEGQLFNFVPGTTEGTWIIQNIENNVFIGSTQAVETKTPVVKTQSSAANYTISSSADGKSAIICTTPVNAGYPAIHLAGDNTRLVPWTTSASASLWYIEPTNIQTAIATIEAQTSNANAAIYDLQGRKLSSIPQQGVYITSDRKKRIAR